MPQLCRGASAYNGMCSRAGTDVGKFLRGLSYISSPPCGLQISEELAPISILLHARRSRPGPLALLIGPGQDANDFPLINNIMQKVRSRPLRMNVVITDDTETSDLSIIFLLAPRSAIKGLLNPFVCAGTKSATC